VRHSSGSATVGSVLSMLGGPLGRGEQDILVDGADVADVRVIVATAPPQ
jgi:hypothetical protein